MVQELTPVDGAAPVRVHGEEVGDLLLLDNRRQWPVVVLYPIRPVAKLQVLVQRDARICNGQTDVGLAGVYLLRMVGKSGYMNANTTFYHTIDIICLTCFVWLYVSSHSGDII